MSGATVRLQLRACGAARAFVRRRSLRNARRLGVLWRPVALRWRRAMALAARAPGALRSGTQNIARSPWHVHMHLRMEVGSAPQGSRRTTHRPQGDPMRARQVLPQRELRQSNSRASTSNAAVPRRVVTAQTSMRRPNPQVAPTMASTRLASITRQPPMALMQLGPRPFVATQRTEVRESAASRPTPHAVALRLHRSHQPQVLHPVASRPPSANAAFATRSPDLVWRAREPTPAEPFESTQAQTANAPSRPATATPERPAEFDNTPAAGTALRTQPLDPVLVERLTDDVIRRIDRRLRIERERRGL